MYPGTQSILIPAEGIDQEWITSRDEASICKRTSIGMAIAPVACNLNILLTPFLRGLEGFFKSSLLSVGVWVLVLGSALLIFYNFAVRFPIV